ncbi:MAG: hypothetical protein ABSG00_04240, partial [Terracidiphilus sp.]
MATVRQSIPEEVPGAAPAATEKAQAVVRSGPDTILRQAPERRIAAPRVIDQQTLDRRFEALL